MPATTFGVEVKHTLRFMYAMIDLLCGGAHLSLEGNLSRSEKELKAISGASTKPMPPLKRQVIFPRGGFDFVILPLELETKEAIVRRILPQIGIHRHIFHIQIAKDGQLQLMAYDNFHPDCVLTGPQVPEAFLQSLVEQRTLHRYAPANES